MKSTNFSSETRFFTGNVDTEEDDIILSEDPIYSTDPIMNVNLKVSGILLLNIMELYIYVS